MPIVWESIQKNPFLNDPCNCPKVYVDICLVHSDDEVLISRTYHEGIFEILVLNML